MPANKWKYLSLPKAVRNRFTYDDYLRYRMQELSPEAIEEFLTKEELERIEKVLNDDASRDLFNHKRLFYEHFSSWIHREILALEKDRENEFEAFVRKHRNVILKPEDGYAGIGIYSVECCPSFEELCERNYLAEEKVDQAECYSLIHPFSLNTLRVTTLIGDNGEPEVLFAVNQFGSHGSIADNTDRDGIWAVIDDATGIVTAVEINPDNGYVNEIHPDTKQPILGFQNPTYPAVRELALELAKVVPTCRLVGWDIAVRSDGSPELIEGNVTPELDLYQEITGKGLKSELSKYLQ